MIVSERECFLPNGRRCILRSPCEADAPVLLEYLKTTYGETPYLLREPEEVFSDVDQERAFIRTSNEEPRSALLLAEVDGELAGLCSLHPVAGLRRCRHRCDLGIALYQRFCGMGLGRIMMVALLSLAGELGYEQAELEVVDGNAAAMALYEKLGFALCGRRPNGVKYADGSYADDLLMVRRL